MKTTNHYLVINGLGIYSPEILSELTRACTLCSCNLLNIKMNQLGNELSVTLFVAGNWSAIAKIETLLPNLEKKLNIQLLAKRTADIALHEKGMAYTIQVNAIDKTGILQGLTEFLYTQNIPIEETSGFTYFTHTGTRMMSLHLKIFVPSKVHLATLRELFMSYCDDRNLDAFLEPLRS